MAEDIAPALLEELRAAFLENLESDKTAARLLEEIQNGTANYEIAGNYAEQVGTALADAFSAVLTADALPDGKMYWNIADRVVRPLLEQDYELVSDAAVQVQTALNQAAGIGIKAQKAALNTDRVDGLLNKISATDSYDDVAWALGEPVKTFSRSVVDDTLKTNAEFQSRSGLRPKIVRKAEHKCCEWCSKLAGTYDYDYDTLPDDIFRRHENCRCTVELVESSGMRQNVWTKKWTAPTSSGTINTGNTTQGQPDPVANAISVKKGSPISADEAAKGANPQYSTDRAYQINCQRCVQAYELRRRGYAVSAAAYPSANNTILWGAECFTKSGTSTEAATLFSFRQTASAVKKELSNAPDGARYAIYAKWKKTLGGSAHVFIAEKTNGVVRYLDPQNGKTDVSHYFSLGSNGNFGYCRLDDKQITTNDSTIFATVKKR